MSAPQAQPAAAANPYAALSVPLGSVARAVQNTTAKTVVQKDVVQVWTVTPREGGKVTPENERKVRNALYAALATSGQVKGQVGTLITSWFLTLLFLIFPGFESLIATASVSFQMAVTSFPDDMIDAALADALGSVLVTGPIMGNWRFPFYPRKRTPSWEVAGHFAILVYYMAKQIDDRGFTNSIQNRIRAITGMVATSALPDGLMGALIPTKNVILGVQSALASYKELRQVLVPEIVSWGGSPRSIQEHIVTTTSALWAFAGLNHVEMIRQFLFTYGEDVSKISVLKAEGDRFLDEYKKTLANDVALFPYEKVINPQSSILASRNFPELVKITVQLARSVDAKMKNYNRRVGKSPYYGLFTEIVEARGDILPQSVDDGGLIAV